MLKRAWKNRYIDLVEAKPEYIVRGESESLTPEQGAQILRRSSTYPRTVCELCCGSGGHLIELAVKEPGTFFLGFELRFKRCYNAAKKAERLGLSNVLLVRTSAFFLPKLFPPASLDGIYINFPDPWDHHRWKKHRILQPDFIDQIALLLKPGGLFSHKTDHAEYFEATLNAIRRHPVFAVRSVVRDLYAGLASYEGPQTEFEKLFRSKGLPIFLLEAETISR